MPFFSSGSLTTDVREVAVDETWDTQSDWDANQSSSNVEISSGVVQLAELSTPDSEDLLARYDATQITASDGDSVSSWSDETGNGHDLTQSTSSAQPAYTTGVIGGNPVVRFDGTDDELNVGFTAEGQPNHIFAVFQFRDVSGSPTLYDTSDTGLSNQQRMHINSGGDWSTYAGTALANGSADTSAHISESLFDGANSTIYIDGVQQASGDVGTQSLDGFRVGARADLNDYGQVDVGEILVYPMDKSGIQSDVEEYLSDKWGISLS